MTQTLEAIYDGEVLRPQKPVQLEPNSRVHLAILTDLPPQLVSELEDFIEYLREKRAKHTRGAPRFDWAGVLTEEKAHYTSVRMQHEIRDMRADEQ